MSTSPDDKPRRGAAREAILEAAVDLIRTQGLHATTVDDLCRAAGVTKGAFFHHFATKDDLAVAAAHHWSVTTSALFAAADYHDHPDPADRVFAYLDFRAALVEGEVADFTCLVGTMVQEAYDTSPAVRQACADSIFGHTATLEADLAATLEAVGADPGDAPALARHTQVVLQGGFILSKAAGGPEPTLESIEQLRRYFRLLLRSNTPAVRAGSAVSRRR